MISFALSHLFWETATTIKFLSEKKGAISHPMGLVFGSHIISLWWHLAGLTSSDESWVLEICNSCSVPEAFFPDELRCLKKGAS